MKETVTNQEKPAKLQADVRTGGRRWFTEQRQQVINDFRAPYGSEGETVRLVPKR